MEAAELQERGWTLRDLLGRNSGELDRIRKLLTRPVTRWEKARLKRREESLLDEIAELHCQIAADNSIRPFRGGAA